MINIKDIRFNNTVEFEGETQKVEMIDGICGIGGLHGVELCKMEKWNPVPLNQDHRNQYGFHDDSESPLLNYFDAPFKGVIFIDLNKHGDFILRPQNNPRSYLVLKRIKFVHELENLMNDLKVKQIKKHELWQT